MISLGIETEMNRNYCPMFYRRWLATYRDIKSLEAMNLKNDVPQWMGNNQVDFTVKLDRN